MFCQFNSTLQLHLCFCKESCTRNVFLSEFSNQRLPLYTLFCIRLRDLSTVNRILPFCGGVNVVAKVCFQCTVQLHIDTLHLFESNSSQCTFSSKCKHMVVNRLSKVARLTLAETGQTRTGTNHLTWLCAERMS